MSDQYKQLNRPAANIDELLDKANEFLKELPENYCIIGGANGAEIIHRNQLTGNSVDVLDVIKGFTIQEGEHIYNHNLQTEYFALFFSESSGKPINPQLKAKTKTTFTLYSSKEHLNVNLLMVGKIDNTNPPT